VDCLERKEKMNEWRLAKSLEAKNFTPNLEAVQKIVPHSLNPFLASITFSPVSKMLENKK